MCVTAPFVSYLTVKTSELNTEQLRKPCIPLVSFDTLSVLMRRVLEKRVANSFQTFHFFNVEARSEIRHEYVSVTRMEMINVRSNIKSKGESKLQNKKTEV
jgi:hypothetical protein